MVKVKKSCSCAGCTLALVLEAERLDQSYKTRQEAQEIIPPPPVVIREKVKPSKAERDKRDKLYFNAGRYAAGARDTTALQAHEQLQKELYRD